MKIFQEKQFPSCSEASSTLSWWGVTKVILRSWAPVEWRHGPIHKSGVSQPKSFVKSSWLSILSEGNCWEQEWGWDKESSQLSRSLDNRLVWCQGFPADMEFCNPQRPWMGTLLLPDPHASGTSSGLHPLQWLGWAEQRAPSLSVPRTKSWGTKAAASPVRHANSQCSRPNQTSGRQERQWSLL